MVKAKDVAEAGFKYIGTPYSQMDCQAFVEKCLSDCGIKKDLPGSNAWYRECKDNGWVGSPEECVKRFGFVPVGAFIFILKHDGNEPEKYKPDGIGNASHIGIVTHVGEGALNSSSSKGCVCESKFKDKTIKNGGWNQVGLWNKLDYETEEEPAEDEGEQESGKATVHSENGLPVKMRSSPSTSCPYYSEVPNGTIVDLLDWEDDWSKIRYNGQSGYMMSSFLIRGEVTPGEPDEDYNDDYDDEYVMVRRSDLLEIYNAIGQMLQCVG